MIRTAWLGMPLQMSTPDLAVDGIEGLPEQDGDAVILFNFRADRMVEISKAFEYEEFNAFDRVRYPKVGPDPLGDLIACTHPVSPICIFVPGCSCMVPSCYAAMLQCQNWHVAARLEHRLRCWRVMQPWKGALSCRSH